jgi:trigger factor
VKQELLPDADDEFAQSLDDGFDTLDELTQRIDSDLTAQKQAAVRDEYRNELVDLLVARATLDFPQVLVDREIDRLIDIESNHASHTEEGLQQWLTATGQTLDDLRERLQDPAEGNVRRALVLGELAAIEELAVDDGRVDEELDSLVGAMSGGAESPPEQAAAIRQLVDTPEGRASISNRILTQLTLERLEEIGSQDGDEDEGEAAERSRRRGRRRRGAADASDQPDAPTAEQPDDAEAADNPEAADDSVRETDETDEESGTDP